MLQCVLERLSSFLLALVNHFPLDKAGLVTIDAVTFPAGFVGFSTEQVFLRTHLISFRVCDGRPVSEPEQCLCEIVNLALPSHFFLSSCTV